MSTEKEDLAMDIEVWLINPITRKYISAMKELFDPHQAILSQERGSTVDFLIGQERVMDYVVDPKQAFLATRDE